MSATPIRDGGIRRFRAARGSAPITRALYASASDPTALAFQLTAMFEDKPLLLASLQKRWNVGRPKAAAARRFLIDAGYWVELRVQVGGGRWNTETVTWETPFTFDELAELAAEYPPGTRLECGGAMYVVAVDNQMIARVAENCHPARPGTTSVRVAENCHPARPGTTETGLQKTVTRRDQAQQEEPAARAECQKSVVPPSSSSHVRHEKHHDGPRTRDDDVDRFWEEMNKIARVDLPGRRAVKAEVQQALSGSWTPITLGQWVRQKLDSSRVTVGSPGGFVVSQLRSIPASPPSQAMPKVNPRAVINACELCDEYGLIDLGDRMARCTHQGVA